MKASPAEQRVLLDLADIDRRISQAEAARANPKQKARIAELQAQRQSQLQTLTARAGERDDIALEVSRVENDVTTTRNRLERDRERLAATSDVKQAAAYEREIESLTARLDKLQDTQLEAMGRLEGAEAAFAAQEELIRATNEEGATLSAEAKAAVADAASQVDALVKDRAAVASKVIAPLLSAYERLAARGTGAALLRYGMCDGCRIQLPASDIADLRAAAADDVRNCPECGTILIRTEESGL